MIRLISEELKKLFHNKLNWLLIAIMILYPWYMTYKNYHSGLYLNNMLGSEHQIENKTELSLVQDIDKKAHELAGPLNQAKVDELYQKGLKELEKIYTISNLDDAWMKEQYGKDYLDFIERGSQGMLTEEELASVDFDRIMFSQDGDKYFFRVEFKENSMGPILSEQYFLEYNYHEFVYYLGDNQFSILEEVQSKQALVSLANREYFSGHMEHSDSDTVAKQWQIASKVEKENAYMYDSTYPNAFLERSLGEFNFFLLLILSFVTSNIFYVEKQRRTEPILFTTKEGKQLFKAKLFAGMLLAFMVATITIIGIFVQSYIFLPVRDFSLYGVPGTGHFYGDAPLLFTYGKLIFVEVVSIIACYLFVAMVTMGVSCISKNAMISFGLMVVILVGPMFVSAIQENPILRGVFPSALVTPPYAISTVLSLIVMNGKLYFNLYLGWLIYFVISAIIFIIVHKIGLKHQA